MNMAQQPIATETATVGKLTNEARLLWIHCNKCWEIYIKKQKRIFLLACQHVACETCAPPQPAPTPAGALSFKCPICSKMVRGRQIANNMPPHIKELFHPQPYMPDLPQMKIMRFQGPHQAHFMEGINRVERKVIQMEKSNEILRTNARKKFEELELARAESARLIKRVREIQKQRKEKEEERTRREADYRKQLPILPIAQLSTTDESSISHNRMPIQRRRGIHSAFLPASYPHHQSAGPRPRAPNPSTGSYEISSFINNHNNSFYL